MSRDSFSLHAATRIAADDRLGLEKLCRYVARPALAAGRLCIINTDQLSFGCGFCFTQFLHKRGTPIPGTNVLWV
ncbi:MAG: transposase [Arenicellales bacterium]|nr:transposase [Arenicellales bacterium]